MQITITIDLCDYVESLNDFRSSRAKNMNWHIPDYVWGYFVETLENGTTYRDMSAMYIIDNMAVNGSYGSIEEYLDKSEYQNLCDEDGSVNMCKLDELKEKYEDYTFFVTNEDKSEYGVSLLANLGI